MEQYKCPRCGWVFMCNKWDKLYCPRCRNLVASFKRSGCFIATAVYGDPNAEEIQILRDFRDSVSHIMIYKLLFNCYYIVSPRLLFIFKNQEVRKDIRKYFLNPIVKYLKRGKMGLN